MGAAHLISKRMSEQELHPEIVSIIETQNTHFRCRVMKWVS